MNFELIYPMAAMVLLTFCIMVVMLRGRIRAVRTGEATPGYYKTYQEGGEPREAAQLTRHVVNMFESPTLFYAAGVAGIVMGQNATAMLALAWLYVALRVVHAFIHTGRNKLMPRMQVYFASLLVLLGMWGTLVIGVATGQ